MKNIQTEDKYGLFKKANMLTEFKAYFALKARKEMYQTFIRELKPKKRESVLDVGVTPIFSANGAKTVTNNYFETAYPYTEQITATSIEDAAFLKEVYPGLHFVQTKPYKTPFTDKQFDVLFCNAVVEHTGSREQQRKFIYEYTRVAKRFLFTTPNRWFPIEMHSMLPLVHWLPKRVFRKVLMWVGADNLAKEEILHLLSAREFLSLFPKEANIHMKKIRTCGWISNIVIYGQWKNGT